MASPRRVHRSSKRLGQNFLVDQRLAEEIVSSVSPGPGDVILEPGPGHGVLTRLLQEKAGRVIAIEKDPMLVHELRETFRDDSKVTILEGDILKMRESLPAFNKLVSTPPYYISAKFTLLLASKKFDLSSVVFQKEFGERLLAKPGTPDYGRLTVTAGRRLDIDRVRDISREAFRPRPKVDSVLLRVRPKQLRAELDEVLFEEMVRGIFTQRRRLLKGALLHFLTLRHGRDVGRKLIGRMSLPDARVYEMPIEQLENVSLQLWRVLTDAVASGQLVG